MCLRFICSFGQIVLWRLSQICFKVDEHMFSLSLKINHEKKRGLDLLADAWFCFIDDILLMTDQQDFESLEIPVWMEQRALGTCRSIQKKTLFFVKLPEKKLEQR
jgi:hypothetical protein